MLNLLRHLPQLLDDGLSLALASPFSTNQGDESDRGPRGPKTRMTEGIEGSLTHSASGLTPFSIIEIQIDSVRRSIWQFCTTQSVHTSLLW